MSLKRDQDENILEYKIRLCQNKTMYDLSWSQIANLINNETGEKKDESTYRKWWNAFIEGYELGVAKNVTDIDIIKEIDQKRIDAEKAVIQFRDYRNDYASQVRKGARNDLLKNIVTESLQNVKPYEKLNHNIPTLSENDLLVGLNDIHFGANIDTHWNKYNSDVAKERLSVYLNNIIKIKETHGAENCYVCGNGDFISGNIHLTIQVSNKENVVEQVMGVSELISWFLSELCNHFKHVYFSSVSGNHSRISTKDNSPKDERLDNIIPWYVKSRLSNFDNFSVIDCDIDNTINIVNIRGLNYLNVHGDYDKFSNCHKIIQMLDIPIYCVHMGHLHHNKTDWIQNFKVIMSGSVQGMDDYCIEKRILGKAQQLVCVCNKNGICCHYDIDLQD